MNQLYVRVAPKSGNTQFYRCAMLFTLAWLFVEVDDATKQRLEEEQMLETSEAKPADYVDPAPVEAAPVEAAPKNKKGAK